MRFGDLAVAALPGEVFVEFGLEIKRRSPAGHTMVIHLANDWIGYLPTEEAFAQGGYEPTPAATHYDRTAGRRVTESAVAQLEALFA